MNGFTDRIKEEAARLGFSACGVTRAEYLAGETVFLDNALKNNYHADMKYIENRQEMRLNPQTLFEGAKSVISLAYNYYSIKKQTGGAPVISKYAYGRDYHFVLKQKLNRLMDFIKQEKSEADGKTFVDSAPLLEKALAQRAGTGWIGKNSNLIVNGKGSFYFLAELVLNMPLRYDEPAISKCGACTRCIDACPTGAIVRPYVVDARKCISYLTVELKGSFPEEPTVNLAGRMFGCDICQDACPWNIRFAVENNEPDFAPSQTLLSKTGVEWENLTKEEFLEIFRNSAVKRTKYEGLKRNILQLKNKV
ncbi:MAG: tRNA epoxyqueuosine(34) reductase QueG [Prevotellaceae bacterium]|jgi:epoxyqueuosine reductase|nr:tRNA epoxyqueuosine(34) reductase QueG [Prevotellaceae bacterium]